MAQETNEGAAYLIALKQSGSTVTSTAPAPARNTVPAERSNSSATPAPSTGSQSFASKEKRRTPRYKLEGSAELREEGRDMRTWATFSDISLHGCYVEATATADVGTVLQIKLEANGVRIETRGCVRVSYPSLGMGIAFTEMSEENRTHLRKLLATISRPSVIVGSGLASSLPVSGSLKALPLISDPGAAVRALIEYFENRQMLTQEEFLRVLRTSQRPTPALSKPSRF
jgi:hypothetical protein